MVNISIWQFVIMCIMSILFIAEIIALIVIFIIIKKKNNPDIDWSNAKDYNQKEEL